MEIQTSEIDSQGYRPKKTKWLYLAILVVVVFFLGGQFGRSGLGSSLNFGESRIFVDKSRENAPQEVDWQLLWDTISLINEKYVDRPSDMVKVLYGAVSGAVASLDDPYSVFFPPQEAEDFRNELKGNFEGIGAEIAIKNQRLTVVTPIEDSPAIKAGIRAGDFIFKVDNQETRDMSLEEAVSKIRGPAGSAVVLTVFHKGQTAPTEIKINRSQIVVRSLSTEVREVAGKKVGILKLRRFGEETDGEMSKAISEFLVKNVNAVILDVRNNPGGFLDTAREVASNWVTQGQPVVIQRFGSGTEEIYKAEGVSRLAGMPTVVLINGGSASASEIVAGALKDYDLATLVGEKSFGKGSVQELLDLRGKAQVKITIAKWLTPKGHDLNKEGLEPDVKVELTTEDFQNDRDPQLDRAFEILSNK